jgi:hypothetical protein
MIIVFWNVTPCNLVNSYQVFGVTYALYLRISLKLKAAYSCETLVYYLLAQSV